jgi:hypothetical protein
MWQMPTLESAEARATPKNLRAWVSDRFGLEIESPKRAAAFPYQTTHRSIDVQLWTAEVTGGRTKAAVWRSPTDFADLPVSNLQKRALAQLR